ncbi:hypothetical protein [Flavobacterium sp. 7A]|uniref:hypothetical protein n=1 Tax=Flavobacterium sp. 7A TaxID=2940571 RepID=UPI0022270DC0|nr:hypothetical protein [Flavobacterium sp. 7A]MCW2121134.1 hypothetical protein [Flavobacterium sp. 7A]
MKKNYPLLKIGNPVKEKMLTAKWSKLFLFVAMILLSINSNGQIYNSEIPVPLVNGANFSGLTASVTQGGGLGCLLCSYDDVGNLVDNNTSNFATSSLVVGLGGSHTFTVADSNTLYDAGSFVGFKIQGSSVLDLLGSITVRTYNNNSLVNTFDNSGLLSLLDGGNSILGGNATAPFNRVSITITGLISAARTTNIFHAVIREYSAGPDLDCNKSTAMNLPTYPVIVDQTNTGVTGIATGGLSNTDNLISSSTSDYASINLGVSVLATGSIAVKD